MAIVKVREGFPDTALDPKGYIDFVAEELVPDGTNGGTFTDDAGTDGQQQYNFLRFLADGDSHAWFNFVVPGDYAGNMKAEIYWSTATNAGGATASTLIDIGGTIRFMLPGTELTTAGTDQASSGTALDVVGTVLDRVQFLADNHPLSTADVMFTSTLNLNPTSSTTGQERMPVFAGDWGQFKLSHFATVTGTNISGMDIYGGRIVYDRGVTV